MKVILLLLLINVVIFSPRYFFRLPKNWNPLGFIFTNDPVKDKVKSIYFSRIIDPFRIAVEYTFPVIILLLFGFHNNISVILLSVIAVLFLSFNVYAGIFIHLMHRTPIIKSDLLFLKDSVSFYKGKFLLIALIVIILFFLFGYLFYYLTSILFTYESQPILLLATLSILFVIGLLNLKHFGVKDYFARTVFSLFIFISKSNQQSKKYNSLFKLSKSAIQQLNQFSEINLKTKPNIHFISMESYGSILWRDQNNYSNIRTNLNDWKTKFEQSNIGVSSSFTAPPLFATGTWYSYSTLLFGMKIDDAEQYNMLFNEMQNFKAYESLFHFSKRMGYTNFLLQGMMGEFESTLDFDKLKRNLNYDHLLYNTDLAYEGQQLKFMNLQNSIPDQFTFNKGLDIVQNSNNPYTFFWCTLNSHYDFNSPTEIVPDWKKLNDPKFKFETTVDGKLNKNERYEIAVNYTIDAIFDTVLKRIRPNDIFITYGDHQPTMVADEKFGLETPMHIFSHNKEFLKEWEQFGFQEGLIPTETESKNYLKFESFYSAFMKCVNKVYGEHPDLEVEYKPDGITLKADV